MAMPGNKENKTQSTEGSPPIYVTAWGWNSGGRAGNLTEDEIRIPKQLQRSTFLTESFIGCSAGNHHTLLVSNEGRIYALGEGKRGQLGFGNQFTDALNKGGVYQAIPKLTTPSGAYKNKKDLKISQVACGGSFSVARELSTEEGINIVTGFRSLEQALAGLRTLYDDSSSIQHAWSYIRQERFCIMRRSEGQVLVWGTGEYGELGLGVLGKVSLYPQPIFKFRDMCITHIAAGSCHVLAIDSQGRLYSWGCGRGGRLGHGDFFDRDRPEIVKFFTSLYVETCAAGDAHSAVLTTMRAGVREMQLRRISTFGRGAHGRLGNGTNRNKCTPVLVSQWLPSLQNVQFHELACGGAHTLVLGSKEVPQCIANPRGRETFIAAWGYGTNGQLGTGYRYDSFVPVKVRMPKWDVITEISAGRSWSMAKSAGGELYTWGKGLRGQLGQGPEKFSLAPRKIQCFASFVHISSGYAHNVCIAVPKKYLSTQHTEQLARKQGRSYDPFTPYIPTTLNKSESTSIFAFDCCRRQVPSAMVELRRVMRFRCLDCRSTSICLLCAKLCHRGHRVVPIDPEAIRAVEDPELPDYEVSARDFMPYRCAVMLLSNRHMLRPKLGALEKMPRVSILDLSSYLKHKPVVEPGRRVEVLRRSREAMRENEVNPRYLQVDRALHRFQKPTTVSNKQKDPIQDENNVHTKFKHITKVKTIRKRTRNQEEADVIKATKIKVPCCRCGVFNTQCRVIPVIPEHPDEDRLHQEERSALKTQNKPVLTIFSEIKKKTEITPATGIKINRNKSPLLHRPPEHVSILEAPTPAPPPQPALVDVYFKKFYRKKAVADSRRDPTSLRNHYLRRALGIQVIAATRIQRLGKQYVRACHERKKYLEHIILRREVCTTHYNEAILGAVFHKVWKEYGHYREQQEQADMENEELLTRKYSYYIKLQQGIIGIEAIAYGLRQLCGIMTPALPRITVDGTITDQWRPMFAHTYNSMRAQLMRLPALRRPPPALVALVSRNLPRVAEGHFKEGRLPDADLMLFTDRYWKDQQSENWRHAVRTAKARTEAMRHKIAAMALERLKAKQNATKLMMQQAEALTLKNNQKASGLPPAPPTGPPPRFMVVRAAMEAKHERLRKLRNEVRDQERLEDAEFSITQKGLETTWRARRHTISDPSELYRRITSMRSALLDRNRLKRRDSLPGNMKLMHMPAQALPAERIEQVQQSLELFTQRFHCLKKVQDNIMKSRVNNAYVESEKRKSNDTYLQWAGRLFQKAVLSPRLPCEMNALLINGYRRRTIGEPERLARQLSIMMDTRETYCEFVENMLETNKYSRRRRSFDHGEELDAACGVSEALGFEYEEVKKVSATVTSLRKDSLIMEQMMVKAKMIEPCERTENAFKENDDAMLGVNMANRFANPTIGTAAAQKKVPRKEKAKGGLSAMRLGADKANEASGFSEYDFSYFNDAPQSVPVSNWNVAAYESEYNEDGAIQGYDTELADDVTGTLASWEEGVYPLQGADVNVWQEHYTEGGQTYYYNVNTGMSSWDFPAHPDAQIETQNQDENGSWFWFNSITGESKWM